MDFSFDVEKNFPYTSHAHETARKAAIQARLGFESKNKYFEADEILKRWYTIMVNAPVTLHNSLFAVFITVEFMVSWEVYRDILLNIGFPVQVVGLGVALLCILINGWASVTGHFIGRGWSKDIHDWERWNYYFIINRGLPPGIIEENLENEKLRARKLAVRSGIVLFILVIVSVVYRTIALNKVAAGSGLLKQAQLITMAVVPLIILIGELFTGDFLWYSLKMWRLRRRKREKFDDFFMRKNECARLDQLAVEYANGAKDKKQRIDVTGDLQKSHQRHLYRTLQKDNYLDPFEKERYVNFTFRDRGSATPLPNRQVKVVLPNQVTTDNFITDDQGKVSIRWEGEHECATSVIMDEDREWLGPFQIEGEYFIDVVQPSPNGSNGKH